MENSVKEIEEITKKTQSIDAQIQKINNEIIDLNNYKLELEKIIQAMKKAYPIKNSTPLFVLGSICAIGAIVIPSVPAKLICVGGAISFMVAGVNRMKKNLESQIRLYERSSIKTTLGEVEKEINNLSNLRDNGFNEKEKQTLKLLNLKNSINIINNN